jgi:hypothetical protein
MILGQVKDDRNSRAGLNVGIRSLDLSHMLNASCANSCFAACWQAFKSVSSYTFICEYQ